MHSTDRGVEKSILGNAPVDSRLNVEQEIRRFRRDPLEPLIQHLGESIVIHGESGRYYRAYDFYALSLERILRHISIGRRFRARVRPHYGRGWRLTDSQKAISKLYREQRPFFELDFTNYLIHARILMDRTIAFGRRFLEGDRLPSFTSFAEHKKFLKRSLDALADQHRPYQEYIVSQTDWFDMPLKFVRDKLMVHTRPKHFLFLGYPSDHDLEMMFIPAQHERPDDLSSCTSLKFSVRRLAWDIETFLDWYSKYALAALEYRNS